jgi:CheY-like chemotaxis protein
MPRILVVDDEPLIAMLVEDWLNELHCETVGPVGSAREALTLIDGQSLDGAILDVSLGNDNSFPIADALLDRGVPFAFATGHSADRIEPRFKDAPTLVKPYDFERIREVLAALLDGSLAPPRA